MFRKPPLLRLLLLLPALGLCLPAPACVKSLRWSDDAPYSARGADGELQGIDIEINQELMRRLGCRLEFKEMPFGRGLRELEAGSLDMMGSAFRRPERERFAWFSAPVLQARKRLFVRRADLPGFRARNLREWLQGGVTLGVLPGVVYGPEFSELQRDPALQPHIHTVVNRRSLWLMLDRERIDGMLVDELTAGYELRRLALDQRLAPAPLVVESEPSYTAFSKRSTPPEFVARYNEALAAMARDGSLARILTRHGNRPP
ncbi:substrate-binding periplasmic protein [Inhella sp.]|uniref:substrate-binding periplasmic protein n=1 Tax=Inhella sp. TaxID=1921806 RepID=UPI0035B39FDC